MLALLRFYPAEMKDTELKRQRDRALYDSYRTAIQERTFANVEQAAEYVRHLPAPRFYISSKALSELIGYILRGKKLPPINHSSTRRLKELYRRFEEFRRANPDSGLSRERICEIILDEPAPEYYVGIDLAIKIIAKERALAAERLIKRYTR